jgi:hypothetical protein
MDFSILINSRERPAILTEGLLKLQKFTSDTDKIEVLINFDDDDVTVPDLTAFPFVFSYRSPRTSYLHTNINRLYKECTGKYIWCLNDDGHVGTDDWDEIALEELKKYEDGIIAGGFYDDSLDKIDTRYASFPLISRKAIDAVGFVIPDEIMSWGGDVFTWKLYSSINRYIVIEDVIVNHITRNGTRPSDHLREEMLKKYYGTPEQVGIHDRLEINEHVSRLVPHLI